MMKLLIIMILLVYIDMYQSYRYIRNVHKNVIVTYAKKQTTPSPSSSPSPSPSPLSSPSSSSKMGYFKLPNGSTNTEPPGWSDYDLKGKTINNIIIIINNNSHYSHYSHYHHYLYYYYYYYYYQY